MFSLNHPPPKLKKFKAGRVPPAIRDRAALSPALSMWPWAQGGLPSHPHPGNGLTDGGKDTQVTAQTSHGRNVVTRPQRAARDAGKCDLDPRQPGPLSRSIPGGKSYSFTKSSFCHMHPGRT